MKIKKTLCLMAVAFIFEWPMFAHASDSSPAWQSSVVGHVVQPYQDGSWDVYLTGCNWHTGATFSKTKLNAKGFGGGMGKHWSDASGHQDMLYAFAFSDSYKHVQPVIGYARQWFTKPMGPLSFGAGFTVGFTARSDMFHYLPLPMALPVFSMRVNKLSLMSTVIPRRRGALGLIVARYEL